MNTSPTREAAVNAGNASAGSASVSGFDETTTLSLAITVSPVMTSTVSPVDSGGVTMSGGSAMIRHPGGMSMDSDVGTRSDCDKGVFAVSATRVVACAGNAVTASDETTAWGRVTIFVLADVSCW